MCTELRHPGPAGRLATRRVPSTLIRRSISGFRPGCSAQAECTTASTPSTKRSTSASLELSPRSARCHRTPDHGSTSGGCRRASPRTSATPLPGAVRRRSSAVPTLPLAPVTATVRPWRWSRVVSAMPVGYPPAGGATGRGRAYGVAVITGAHVIVSSTDADRAFLAELLGRPGVDAGGGWLITRLPPGLALRAPAGHLGRPVSGGHPCARTCAVTRSATRSAASSGSQCGTPSRTSSR